jgi:uncharacterized protein YecE (DUF72 family)
VHDDRLTTRVGCSGWNYASWRQAMYGGAPSSRWLTLYARLFDTVEVNSTFYRLPRAAAVRAWAEATPDGFAFAVKASRYITHVKRLRDMEQGLERLYEPLQPLVDAGKLGPVLWQLPPTFRRDDDRLAAALEALPRGLHAFELRHASWFADPVYELLERHGAALVVADHPARPLPPAPPTAPWAYVRLHHGHRGRNGNYSESELRDWAARIASWDCSAWVYFNNDWEAFAPANARELRRFVPARHGAPA